MTTESITTQALRRRSKTRQAGSSGIAPIRGLVPLLAVLLLWQFLPASQSTRVNFPPPSEWFVALLNLGSQGRLLPAFWQTTYIFLVALVLATVLGSLLGMLLGSSPRITRAFMPLFEFLRALPSPAVIPIAVLLVGATDGMSVAVIVFTAFWPIVFNVLAALLAVPQVRLDLSRTLNLSGPARMVKVITPSIAPSIALGVRVSVPLCLIMTLVTEMVASKPGLGQLLLLQQRAYDASSVFGLLLLFAVIGYTLTVVVSIVEAQLLRNWPQGL